MSRTGRVLVVVAAWVLPVAWLAVALLAGPSDGTAVSRSVFTQPDQWGSGVTVVEEYGDGRLRPGDVVLQVDDRSIDDWVANRARADRVVGEQVTYQVRRQGPDLDLIIDVQVTLTRYPVEVALARHAATAIGFALALLAGTLLFWRRPDGLPQRALLAAAALGACSLASAPLGLGAIDLAGSRGVWPQLAGEALCVLGLGALLGAALTFPRPHPVLHGRSWPLVPAALLPAAAYAVWAMVHADGLSPELPRLQGLITLVFPALILTVPVVLVLVAWSYARSHERSHTLATRLVLVALVGGLLARVLVGDLPERLTGQPLLPWDVLVLLITPAVLACVVVAVDGHRLEEVEPAVRRALVQALAAALVTTAFVAVAAAVGSASDISFRSLLAGGVIALLVLPLAVALQRTLRRLVYGDREFPQRIVADLRRLDPSSAPEQALTETLAVLARRLRLSHAEIDVQPADGSEPVLASIGERGGQPVAVELVAGGTRLGQMTLEVAANRDPFGPGDRRLLEDVGEQVGALVQTVLANRALQRSRQHLISAREEERRRLRRDLHDGLGPSLASLAMRLEAVPDLIARDPSRAAELVESLSEQARGDIAEVRRLVDGLRPPALDQLGLVSALRQRAEELRVPGAGGRMTWTVEAAEDVEPLPAAVEVAAYRIALEAVTNALRHSGAETCTVTLHREDRTLVLRVRDTGRGLAEDPGRGVGLTSMRERAEELGGTCTVRPDGAGTIVEARLPIAREEGD